MNPCLLQTVQPQIDTRSRSPWHWNMMRPQWHDPLYDFIYWTTASGAGVFWFDVRLASLEATFEKHAHARRHLADSATLEPPVQAHAELQHDPASDEMLGGHLAHRKRELSYA